MKKLLEPTPSVKKHWYDTLPVKQRSLIKQRLHPDYRKFFERSYKNLAARCRRSGRDNELSPDIIRQLFESVSGKCFYTGTGMTIEKNNWNTVSVDRYDNDLGYTIENTRLCCTIVNRMKSDLLVDEFKGLCREIAANF